jgi:hypothetical protein
MYYDETIACSSGLYCNNAVGIFVMNKLYIKEENDRGLYEKWKKVYKAQLDLSDTKTTRYMWAAPGL